MKYYTSKILFHEMKRGVGRTLSNQSATSANFAIPTPPNFICCKSFHEMKGDVWMVDQQKQGTV